MAFFTTQRKETGSYNTSELSHAAADARAKYITKKRKMAN